MKKLLLCLLAITAAISTAWAQTPKKNIFGLRVGMDMSKISILDTGSGEKYLSELRTSFNIYNRENETYNFLKRNVQFSLFFHPIKAKAFNHHLSGN